MPGIPTYGADGLRRRNHSLETLLYLESRKAVLLRRTRKGKVVCARFNGESSIRSERELRPEPATATWNALPATVVGHIADCRGFRSPALKN
jgi:hypothetical protein